MAVLLELYLAIVTVLMGVAMGSAALVMTAFLVDGVFAAVIMPRLKAVARLVPAAALLLVPILLLAPSIYPWARPESAPSGDFPRFYYTVAFASLRLLLLAIVFAALMLTLRHRPQWRAAVASAGLIAYPIAVTLFATDFVRSVDPDFHSSIFGLLVMSSQLLSTFAVLPLLRRAELGREARDIAGKLLFSAGLLWAYMHAMQFIVVWAGNVPLEVAWYLRRGASLWGALAAVVFVGQGCATLALMSQTVRVSPLWLTISSSATILLRLAEVLWLLGPR